MSCSRSTRRARAEASTTSAGAWRARCARSKHRDPREQWEQAFYRAQVDGFIPGGRINSAAGTDLKSTLINCFVQPVGDSISGVETTAVGIYDALNEAAETMRRGGGVGYDFSRIRPQGARGERHQQPRQRPAVVHARVRPSRARPSNRPARAAARRWASCAAIIPDVEEFIHAKDDGDSATSTCASRVTDAFMRGVRDDADWELVHAAAPARELLAAGAHRRADGLWVYRKVRAARPVAADHASHLRSRRAGRAVHRRDQPRQQPPVLRGDRGQQSRAASNRCRRTGAAISAAST